MSERCIHLPHTVDYVTDVDGDESKCIYCEKPIVLVNRWLTEDEARPLLQDEWNERVVKALEMSRPAREALLDAEDIP